MIAPAMMLAGRYRIVRQIGQGGMGSVYEARDERIDCTVALKRLSVVDVPSHEAFSREARLLAGLRHPSLPKVTDFFTEADAQFLVMEHVPGDDLARLLAIRGEPEDWRTVCEWLDQLMDVLEYLHTRKPPVIHRDIKPSNIKLVPQGRVVLLDFGLAKTGAHDSVPGYTLRYAPIEQLRGDATDARSDLYALAATGYHLLTGHAPPDAIQRESALADGAPDPLRRAPELNPRVPPAVGEWLAKALSLSRDIRFSDASHMRRALRQLMEGDETRVKPVSAASAPASRPDDPSHGAPSTHGSLIGRDDDAAQLARLLRADDTRLVVVTGPGGVGKTRLCLLVAQRARTEFPDGVHTVMLAAMRSPEGLLPAIAHALGLPDSADAPSAARVKAHLGAKRALLLLDNFEHLAEAAPQIADLLDACPRLCALISSRHALGLRLEHDYALEPLAVPPPSRDHAVDVAQAPAVQLFVQRARQARPSFSLNEDNAAAVSALCRRLDGLPLALELAAARTRLLSPEAILVRLNDRFQLLHQAAVDVDPRQSSLRATLDWSYGLLSAPERAALRRLGAFAGQARLEDAEAVLASAVSDAHPLDIIQSLVDKSLIKRVEGRRGAVFVYLLETVREYALERLRDSGEHSAALRCHALQMARMAEDVQPELNGADPGFWFDMLEREHDNIRAAMRWAIESGEPHVAMRIGAAIWRFWQARGFQREGIGWMEQTLNAPVNDVDDAARRARAGAMNAAGNLALDCGDHDRAERWHEAQVPIWRSLGDGRGLARALNNLAIVHTQLGRLRDAVSLLNEALALGRATGFTQNAAHTLNNLGIARMQLGDYDHAEAHWNEALLAFRSVGDRRGQALIVANLGELALCRGRLAEAETGVRHALGEFEALGDKWGAANQLTNLADVKLKGGAPTEALALAARAVRLRREIDDARGLSWALSALATAQCDAGQPDRAAASTREAVSLARSIHDRVLLSIALHAAGHAALALRDARSAARSFGAAERLRRDTGYALPTLDRRALEDDLAAARAQLGDADFGWAFGAGLEDADATARDVAHPGGPRRLGEGDVWLDASATSPRDTGGPAH